MKADSFNAFYRTHYSQVLRFLERRTDQDVAADLCAQCFEIAWRKYDEASPFGLPWLYQTARNLAGNAYRHRARQQQLVQRLEENYIGELLDNIRAGEVLAALWRLPKADRESLELTYWEGLSAADVGLVLGCSEQAAWKRISRAKKRLRESLETEPMEEEGAHVRR